MTSTLFISKFIWAFDVLGSCFLEQQLASHFNETTSGTHHWHLYCPIINVQKKKKWMHELLEVSKDNFLTKWLILSHFRQNQNQNTSKKLTFAPLRDSTGCVRLNVIQGCHMRTSFARAIFMNGGQALFCSVMECYYLTRNDKIWLCVK